MINDEFPARGMAVRHENSYFNTYVKVADDNTLFIALKAHDPERVPLLGTGASIWLSLSKSATLEDAEELSRHINALGRQLLIVVDDSHPLFAMNTPTRPIVH